VRNSRALQRQRGDVQKRTTGSARRDGLQQWQGICFSRLTRSANEFATK
jgi:hypothetical protein